jgi:CheY-like chemotaxis protein
MEKPVPRVLIADDNVEIADKLSELLQGWGCETRTVYDGAQAFAAARDFHPDLALIDLVMPDIHAFELVRRLRQEPGFESTTFLGMTGMNVDLELLPAKRFGFAALLSKPLKIEDLRPWIRPADPPAPAS